MKTSEAMHTGVEWCAPDTSLKELARIMRDNDIGSVPIGENDRLIGMVTDRDIACCLAGDREPKELCARDVMTQGIVYCREQDEIEDALRLMQEKQLRRLPVINSDKRLVGMLTLGDISHSVPPERCGNFSAAVSAHH